jgi:lactate permease
VDSVVPRHRIGELIRAWTPYLLLIIFITNWALPGFQSVVGRVTAVIPFGALAHAVVANGQPITVNYSFVWLSAAGTGILFAAIATIVLQRIPIEMVVRVARDTLRELARPLVTIAAVVGFAYVANYAGLSATLALALSRTGSFFPFLAPFLGWIGVFLTGSDTSSNALFSGVQSRTAQALGLNPVLTVAANSSGGVAAKMISPQSIAVATASTKLVGREGELFRRTVLHSLGIVTIVGLLTYAQAHFLTWMVPPFVSMSAAAVAHFGRGDIVMLMCSCLALLALFLFNQRSVDATPQFSGV